MPRNAICAEFWSPGCVLLQYDRQWRGGSAGSAGQTQSVSAARAWMKKQRVKVDKLETEVGGKSRKTMFSRESLTPEGPSTRKC